MLPARINLDAVQKSIGEYSDKKAMRLVESKTVGEGVVVLVYERA